MRIIFLLFLLIFNFQSTSLLGQIPDEDYFDKASDFFLVDIDSCIYYMQKGIPYYESKEEWSKYVNCYNSLASCHSLKGDFNQSYTFALSAMEAAENKLSKDDIAYGAAINNLAVFAKKRGDYDKAIDLLQKSLKIDQEKNLIPGVILTLNNLGRCFSSKGDYLESKRYFSKTLRLVPLIPPGEKVLDITTAYLSLASIHLKTKQQDTALLLYQKALNFLEGNSTKEEILIARYKQEIYSKMASVFLENSSEKEFQKHIQLAQHFARTAFGRGTRITYILLGKWALKKEKYNEAILHFEKALALVKEKNKNLGRYPKTGEVYYHLAQTYLKKGDLSQSLTHFQSAIQEYTKGFTPTGLHENPQPEDLVINEYSLKILRSKATAQYQFFKKNQDSKMLLASKNTYQLAIQILNKLRQSYLDVGSKEILAENALPIFEGALKSIYALYELEGKEEFLNEAFQLAENSKAILLLESINEKTALGFAGIPDTLLQHERGLKQDIAYYKKQLLQTPKTKSQKIKTIEEGLFDLEKQHRDLIQTFEKKYPDYHHLKYNTSIVKIAEVQKKIADKNSALLEYFVGEKALHVFYISKNKASWKKLDRTSDFSQNVQLIRDILIHPPGEEKAQDDFEHFTKAAHELYQLLIVSANLEKNIQRIQIVPDDILAYLPFEVLLQQMPATTKINYTSSHLSYLLNDFQISYNYSATLLSKENRKTNKAPKDFIGFAPDFGQAEVVDISYRDCVNGDLQGLNCNRAEVQQISTLFKGTSLTGDLASKENFMRNIPDYRIAHFATHSCLDDENPMLSKIILADGFLSNFDLFNLQIRTELSVLSACNTGSGKLRRGEGVMSLSRGFIHAGCPSVLMSLWAVEDCTTSTIMTQYYQGIKVGKTKDLALQDSKKHYLQNANKLLSHPFYWAPFVQFGDIEPMDFGGNRWTKYWPLLLIGGIFIFYFFRRKIT